MTPDSPAALAVAAALCGAPLAVGAAAGRRWSRSTADRALAPLLLPPLGVLVAAPTPLAAWDVAVSALCLGVGWLLGALPLAAVARGGARAALFLVVAEAGTRLALSSPVWLEHGPVRLWDREPRTVPMQEACAVAYPGRVRPTGVLGPRTAPDDASPLVLHLGDSMLVFGDVGMVSSAEEPSRFPAQLDARDPSRHHLNLGVPGTGPDVALAAARAWAATGRVDEVVLYHLPVNDLSDLERRYPCCPGRPLLDWDDPALPLSCPDPDPLVTAPPAWVLALAASPAPLALQVATGRSALVAQLRARLAPLVLAALPWEVSLDQPDGRWAAGDPGLARAWGRFDAILHAARAELADRGVPVTVVVLPSGHALEPARHRSASGSDEVRAAEALARCARAGLRCLDAWAPFRAPPPDGASYYLRDGYHLSSLGHTTLARWLAPRLGLPETPPSP